MSFIGYSASGYTDLSLEISNRKQRLLDILESFVEVETAISNCWKGEDAEAYKEQLQNIIIATKNSVTEAYDTLQNQCRVTYENWVAKQSIN